MAFAAPARYSGAGIESDVYIVRFSSPTSVFTVLGPRGVLRQPLGFRSCHGYLPCESGLYVVECRGYNVKRLGKVPWVVPSRPTFTTASWLAALTEENPNDGCSARPRASGVAAWCGAHGTPRGHRFVVHGARRAEALRAAARSLPTVARATGHVFQVLGCRRAGDVWRSPHRARPFHPAGCLSARRGDGGGILHRPLPP